MSNLQFGDYPANRNASQITEPKPGTRGSADKGEMSKTKTSTATIPFGVFAVATGDNIGLFSNLAQWISGLVEIGQKSSDYGNLQYLTGDAVALMDRGYGHVKIDPANRPVAGDKIYVSYATGKEGWLTSSPTNSLELEQEGIEIKQVYDNVAEVYLAGFHKFYVGGYEIYNP